MDGTLVNSLGFWDYIWRRLGEIYRNDPTFRPDPITEKGVRTSTLYDGMVLLHERCKMGKNAEEVFELVDRELYNYYEEVVEMKEGALDFLEYLKACGVKMCLASASAPHLIDVLMKKFGLNKYFPKIVSCNDVGIGKESPKVFLAALDYLGTAKESTWIFEDSIVAIETAVNAGFHTVGVYDQYNFSLERVEQISDIFIAKGESLKKIIPEIENS